MYFGKTEVFVTTFFVSSFDKNFYLFALLFSNSILNKKLSCLQLVLFRNHCSIYRYLSCLSTYLFSLLSTVFLSLLPTLDFSLSPTSSIDIFTFLLSLLFSFPTHNFLYLPSGQSLVLPLSFLHCLSYFRPMDSDSLSFTLSFFFLKLSFLSLLLCFNQLSPHLSIVCQVDMLQMNAQQSMAC